MFSTHFTLSALNKRVEELDHSHPIVHGPLNKNEETFQLEAIGKALINDKDNVGCRLQGNVIYIDLKKTGQSFSLKTIFARANLQQIAFSVEELNLLNGEFNSFKPRIPDVHIVYQSVAFDYARGVTYFNSILRNTGVDTGYFDQKFFTLRLRDTLLLLSYLNTPDNSSLPEFTVRGENIFSLDVHEDRIVQVKNGGYTQNLSFLSTSNAQEVVKNFDLKDVHQCFIRLRGKDISKISGWTDQKEVLIPPCQLRWLVHQQDGKDRFFAQVIDTPTEASLDIENGQKIT